ncbi:hypothetical protein ACIRSS_23950 [Amycolatopsis sp. NPDC101161]|uniref:5-methylcytosine restriction system specificity protein McrC n=1 Tax=Amycolatopsis sp. NPDC101161 TaxID=3363940 RepID=UPI00382F85F7
MTRADTGEGLYDVHAADRVGTVLVEDTSIVVAPKLAISRVLFLIAHALDPTWTGDAALEEKMSLTEAVALLFTQLGDRATRTGVLRGYRDRHDRLNTVRGRIDFRQQLRRSPGRDLPLAVFYWVVCCSELPHTAPATPDRQQGTMRPFWSHSTGRLTVTTAYTWPCRAPANQLRPS